MKNYSAAFWLLLATLTAQASDEFFDMDQDGLGTAGRGSVENDTEMDDYDGSDEEIKKLTQQLSNSGLGTKPEAQSNQELRRSLGVSQSQKIPIAFDSDSSSSNSSPNSSRSTPWRAGTTDTSDIDSIVGSPEEPTSMLAINHEKDPNDMDASYKDKALSIIPLKQQITYPFKVSNISLKNWPSNKSYNVWIDGQNQFSEQDMSRQICTVINDQPTPCSGNIYICDQLSYKSYTESLRYKQLSEDHSKVLSQLGNKTVECSISPKGANFNFTPLGTYFSPYSKYDLTIIPADSRNSLKIPLGKVEQYYDMNSETIILEIGNESD